MTNELTNPDYLFEVSWEVCNKVGGIYTVIATKSLYLKQQLHKHHILIGPDVWMDTESNPDFIEDPHLYSLWKAQAASEGIRVRRTTFCQNTGSVSRSIPSPETGTTRRISFSATLPEK